MDRRTFLKHASFTAAAVAAGHSRRSTAQPSAPPNVLLITADQMRGDAMSCAGNRNANTPNLDRLASEGVRFENAFVNNPVCVPSRISTFTGLYPHQHERLTNNDGEPIQRHAGTMLQHFRDRGYRTGWIGKNHTYEDGVLEQLDTFIERRREPFRRYVDPNVPPWWHADMYWPAGECYAPKNTRDAVSFIKTAKNNEPFFLHVSYFDPHPPYFAPAETVLNQTRNDMRIPDYVPPEQLSDRLAEQQRALHYDRISDADMKQTLRYYHASVTWGVDEQVGMLMNALEEKGLADNTIVLFTGDHGDFMGHHRMVRKGMFLYDSLLHVPFIVRAPGRLPSGRRVMDLAQGVDIFPTLADLTGGPVQKNLSGRSLAPILRGDSDVSNDHAVFAMGAYSDLPADYFDDPEPRIAPETDRAFHKRVQSLTWNPEHRTAMIRTRDWKFIRNESRSDELYHMNGGTVEQRNLIDDTSLNDKRKELERRLDDVWQW